MLAGTANKHYATIGGFRGNAKQQKARLLTAGLGYICWTKNGKKHKQRPFMPCQMKQRPDKIAMKLS